MLLNKTDLVTEADLVQVEKRLRSVNAAAEILRCTKADVKVESVLNIGAFDLQRTLEMDPQFLTTDGEHEHDTSVSSMSITEPGELDLASVQDWITKLLQTKGADIYRMKGVLNIKHADEMFVYHAVHMIFNHEFTEPWPEDKERGNKLVFIGKNLDKAALRASFADCMATPANLEKKIKALRFKVGQRVLCNVDGWVPGTITALFWRSEDMEPGMVAPYQIELDDEYGTVLSAPTDSNKLVREAPSGGKKRPHGDN